MVGSTYQSNASYFPNSLILGYSHDVEGGDSDLILVGSRVLHV